MSSETANKPKLQLRSTVSFSGDKTPSPATKLLINHGKPNFTIQRTGATKQNGGSNDIKPLSPQGENNNNTNGTDYNNYNNDNNNNNNNNNIDVVDSKTHNYNPYKSANSFYNNNNKNINDGTLKSTKYNGAFRPATLPMTNNNNLNPNDNEAAKVVLRRTKITETSSGSSSITDGDDDGSVPEFIRRQRRIQERLAKENVLDFENRRSGYFTQVMMSPTATAANRTSFAETMSSPAVNPALELPPSQQQQMVMTTHTEHVEHEEEQHEHHEIEITETTKTTKTSNGHHFEETAAEEEEEEEVAKAIEEVNKAVAHHEVLTANGIEDYNAHVHDEHHEQHELIQPRTLEFVMETKEQPPLYEIQAIHPAEHLIADIAETDDDNNHVIHTTHETKEEVVHATVAVATLEHVEEITTTTTTTKHIENGHSSVTETTTTQKVEQQQQNGHNDITISHTNGFEGPCIPAPDPSGVLGVNYEPKTVVSFSKDLATEINKYPDTVKDVDGEPVTVSIEDQRLKELTKLKFDITADEEDVKVTPVLRTDIELK